MEVLRALKRAHRAAMKLARQTGTELVYFEDGKVVVDARYVRLRTKP